MTAGVKTVHAELSVRDGVGLLVLRRPQVRNSLDMEATREVAGLLRRAARDAEIGALVLTGEASAFCAGADAKAMMAGAAAAKAMTKAFVALTYQVERFPKPVLAAVNGPAHGGGAVLATACDMRFAAPQASFRYPGASYGRVVGVRHLPLLVGLGRAREILYTAREVPAVEAAAIGLANRVVDAEALIATTLDVARQIASQNAVALREMKRLTAVLPLYSPARRLREEEAASEKVAAKHDSFRSGYRRVTRTTNG